MRAALLFVALAAAAAAQQDSLLTRARELAGAGQRQEALAMLAGRLGQTPGDVDARLLYGTILSWEHRYDEARTELRKVLATAPNYLDAEYALANVELWSNHPDRAEDIARRELAAHPKDPQLRLALARALEAEHRSRESADEARRMLALAPGSKDALDVLDAAGDDGARWAATFEETHEWFSRTYGEWDEYQLSLQHGTSAGPVIARFSRADRLGLHSNLSEVEFYPHLRRGTEAYVDFGYSYDATLYPHFRTGLDVTQEVGRGWELSGGYRRLSFATPVDIYTGSVAKYAGQWLFTARIYAVPDKQGVSNTAQGSARRYFGRRNSYWGVRVSRGSTPLEITNVTDLSVLRSTAVEAELNQSLSRHWRTGVRAGLSREDRLNNGSLNHWLLDATLRFLF